MLVKIVIRCKSCQYDESEGIPPKGAYFEFNDGSEFSQIACPQCGLNIIDEHQDHEVVWCRGLGELTESKDLNVLAAAVEILEWAEYGGADYLPAAIVTWLQAGHEVDHDAHGWLAEFKDAYRGTWRSPGEYVEQWSSDVDSEKMKDVPDYVVIDWEKSAEVFFRDSDYWYEQLEEDAYAVFSK